MIRTTILPLIDTLRGMTNAGTADYTIAGQSYWQDEQLQAVLDRNRVDIFEQDLQTVSQTATDGTEEWKRYFTPAKWLETTDGGTAVFFLQVAGGSVVPLAEYSVDYERGVIEFTSDRGGQTIYMTARSYDVYAAAADVWEQKAAQAASLIDFSTLNHSVKRAHVSTMYQKQADKYRALSNTGSTIADTVRSDLR